MQIFLRENERGGKIKVIIKERNPMNSPIKLRYTPKKQDYIRASRVLAKNTPTFLILAAVILVAMVAAVVVLVVPGLGDVTWRNIAIVVLLAGIFYTIYYLAFIPYQLTQAYKKNEYLQKTRKFTITDQSVHMEIGDRSTDLAWEHFQKVIDSGTFYLLIYKADQNVYPFLPKRAFDDPSAEQSFLQLLESKSIPVA